MSERESYADRFARYRPSLTDFDAFVAALERPQPTCVTTNRTRIEPERLRSLVFDEYPGAVDIAWAADAWRLPREARPGFWWAYRAGLVHVQEEASILPVAMLDAQPGDRVLDVCAAPGGKTALLAMALGNRGTVIANDRSGQRIGALRDVVKRLGLLNVTITVHDGRELPSSLGTFDRILVDAPCTSEGTHWHGGAAYHTTPSKFRRQLGSIQRRLLARAVLRCRPGGRIVYSTCSFAPEENEAVVDDILDQHPDLNVVAVRASLPGASSGWTRFAESSFDRRLERAVRLWPQRTGTGGFFAVALDKPGDAAIELGAESRPSPAPAADEWFQTLRTRFDLADDVFARLRPFAKADELHVIAEDHRSPSRPEPVSRGIQLARISGGVPRLSTTGALAFGASARRRFVELDQPEAECYQRRTTIEVAANRVIGWDGDCLVVVRHRGFALGTGTARGIDSESDSVRRIRLESGFPRVWIPGGAG